MGWISASSSRTQDTDARLHLGCGTLPRWALAALLALACPSAHAQDLDAGGNTGPAVGAIRFYQRYLSSLRHGRCPFTPSCSEYAARAIARYGLVEGSARAADRLMRCNASAARFYPRGQDGHLADPVDAAQATIGAARVPRWLLLAPEPSAQTTHR